MVQQIDLEGEVSHEESQTSANFEITNDVNKENEIQMGGNSKDTSKLSDASTSLSPSRSVGASPNSSPEGNRSRQSLASELMVSTRELKRPMDGTPRTSTPELKRPVSPIVNVPQPYTRAVRYGMTGKDEKDSTFRGGVRQEDVHTDAKKLDSSASSDEVSSVEAGQSKTSHTLLNSSARSHRNEYANKNWYLNLRQRLEDLSWSYQTLETEYAFLEKFMDEQKKDLEKAKNWANHLKKQSPQNKSTNVYYS